MTSVNLTRLEAQARAAIVETHHYSIHLDLTESDTQFTSITEVSFTARTAGDTFLDLRDATISEVLLDDQPITDTAIPLSDSGLYDDTRGIQLLGLAPGSHRVKVTARATYSHSGQGLHRYVDPADNEVYLYTQFETADAKRMFACFDQPDLKATYEMVVRTVPGWTVITNGVVSVEKHDAHWVHTAHFAVPISTYLVALCAGPYEEVADTWSGTLTHYPETPTDTQGLLAQPAEGEMFTIPLRLLCRRSLRKYLDADRLFRETKQGFDFYHQHFGMAYPFEKYDQVFVPEFNMGAMENAGCVTHRDEYVFSSTPTHYRLERRADTILHEMAHMWFGDLVTMRWWDDLWLNESFATWAAATSQAEATEYDTAWVTFTSVEKADGLRQDILPSTHPISADARDIETVEQNFDGITYAKGASVLRQLQAYVGRDAFFAGVRRHFAHHAFSNATFDDLLESLSDASGRDLSQWSNQWLTTTGVTTLSYTAHTDTDGKFTSFEVNQDGAQPGAGELRDHVIGIGVYTLNPSTNIVERTAYVEVDVHGSTTPVPELTHTPAGDFVLVNDGDLTYCRLVFPKETWDFLLNHIHQLTDPMARALVWSAAWDATRSATLTTHDFLSLVEKGIAVETHLAVLESVLGKALFAVENYADPAWRDLEGRTRLIALLLQGARGECLGGTAAQLVYTMALAHCACGDHAEAEEFFRSILRDEPPAPGITIDPALRWSALIALVAAGRIPEDTVESMVAEERRRDPSSTGKHAAIEALAAIPTLENKKRVFDELVDPAGTLSNLERRHRLIGYNAPGSAALRSAFIADYFACAETLWDSFPSEVANVTLNGLYPTPNTDPAAIDAAETFLAGEHAPGLRRIIVEGHAAATLARAAQLFDAS